MLKNSCITPGERVFGIFCTLFAVFFEVFSGHNFLLSGWTFLNEAGSQYPTKCNKSTLDVKAKYTKKPTMPKSHPPIRFSLQQTKKVTAQIVLSQIMEENETHVPNKVNHNTILKFLDDINNNKINLILKNKWDEVY